MSDAHYFGGVTQTYARLAPCIDMSGHHFQANTAGYICCTRCGTRPPR